MLLDKLTTPPTTTSGVSKADKVSIPQRVKPYTMEIPLEQILPWDGNPEARTTDRSLKELLEAIRDSGVINEIAGVNNDDNTVTTADGHRRRQCGEILGFKKLTVRVYPSSYTPGELYIKLNRGTRTQTATDYLEAYLKGDVLPKNVRVAGYIKFLVRLCGSKDEATRVLLEGQRKITPTVVPTLQAVTVFLEGPAERTGKGGQATITDTHRQVFRWMLQYGDGKLRRLYSTPLLTPGKKLRMLKRALEQNIDLDV